MSDSEVEKFFFINRFFDAETGLKLNVIFVLRTINSNKVQGVHFYIIDFDFSGNQGVKREFINCFLSLYVYFSGRGRARAWRARSAYPFSVASRCPTDAAHASRPRISPIPLSDICKFPSSVNVTLHFELRII